jgi:hypothetical protein
LFSLHAFIAALPLETARLTARMNRMGFRMDDKLSRKDYSERPTEDDIAQAHLGGPRGAPELKPATMTPQRKKKTPAYIDPGHTS